MGIVFEQSRNKYKATIQRNGHRLQKRFKDKNAAEQWHIEQESYLRTLDPKKSPTDEEHRPTKEELTASSDPSFYYIADDYINLKANRHKSYKDNPHTIYHRLRDRFKKERLAYFTSGTMTQHAYKRVDEERTSVTTARKEVRAVIQVLEFARAHYDWKPNPIEWPIKADFPADTRVESEIRGRRDQKPLQHEEFQKMARWIRDRDFDCFLALILLYETSMREGEVIKLKKDFVHLSQTPHIELPDKQHKNKKTKIVMLTPAASKVLELLMDRDTEDGRVFQFSPKTDKGKAGYLWRIFKQAATEVLGRPHLTVHNLRAENASQQRERGIADDLRQRQTGHIDRAVLDEHYTRFTLEYRAKEYEKSFCGVDNPLDI
ncbi:MAG: tyrosine-type recombinase/integrase [Gammaproteobacteria bacterium]|nr:tyrosine-type recombinase/integrase [Gammaproteobacteria bacterium]